MRRLLLIIFLIGVGAGCETPAAQPASKPGPSAALTPAAAALRDRLTGTENGLEMRRWIVANQPDRLSAALAAHVDGQSFNEHALLRLKQNGFRFVRIPVDRLDSFLADVGGASYDSHEWHGQVHDWRSILDRPISPSGRAVAVDGMVHRYDRGEFRLTLRSWTVQMERGPYIHLELLPRHRIPQAQNLRRLLGDGEQTERGFGSMAIDVRLEGGFAYLLMGESPQMDWPGVDPPSESGVTSTHQTTSSASPGRIGETDSFGPDAVAPPTLGELMLAPDRKGSTRGILVFVPKVADALFLPEQAAGRSTTHRNDESAGGG